LDKNNRRQNNINGGNFGFIDCENRGFEQRKKVKSE